MDTTEEVRSGSLPQITVDTLDDEDDFEEAEMLSPMEDFGLYLRKSNHLRNVFEKRRSSLPVYPAGLSGNLSPEVDRRKSSCPPNLEKYTNAARRIHRTISTVASARKLSATQALHFMLEEVNKNEHLNAEDLIKKLQNTEIKRDVTFEEPRNEFSGDTSESGDTEPESEMNEKEDQFGSSLVAKIAQYLAFGSMDLEDFGKLTETAALKNKLETCLDYVLTKLQEEWGRCMEILVPVKQIHTMIFIGFVQILTATQILRRIPAFVAYLSFFLMIYSTLKIFRNRQSMKNFLTWKKLLNIFEFDSQRKNENNFSNDEVSFNAWPSLEPLIIFVSSTLLFIFSFSLSSNFIPNVLSMCLMSIIFTLLCVVALPDKSDKLTWFVYVLDFVVCLSQISNFFLFKTLAEIKFGRSIVHLNVQSLCFFILISIFAAKLCLRKNSRTNYHQFVLPHVVCFFWLQTTLTLAKYSNFTQIEPFNVALTCGLIWLALFPVTGVLVIVIGIIITQYIENLTFTLFLKLVVTLLIFSIPFIVEKVASYANLNDYFKIRKNVALVIFYVVLVIASTAIIYQGNINLSTEATTSLSWHDFEKHCGRTEKPNLKRQLLCTELKGTIVSWTGTVESIQIAKIENFLEYLFTICPNFLADFLRCFYGQFVKDSPEVSELTGRSCSTVDHNVYTFAVELIGPWNSDEKSEENKQSPVILIASDVFREILFQLDEGDVISFAAMFEDYHLNNNDPLQLRLLSITCVRCKNVKDFDNDDSKPEVEYVGFWSNVMQAFHRVFNFVFFPLFSIE